MRAGRLRHRVHLERPAESQSATGEVTRTWERYASVWAAVEPVSGRERFADDRPQSDLTHRVVLRGLSTAVWPRDRVIFRDRNGDRVLEIEHVADRDERGITVELMVRERIDG